MKFYNYAVLILFFLCSVKADDQKNQIYFELAGHGIMYSLNYERMISEDFSLRVGASAWEFDFFIGDKDEYKVFPVTINVITGKTKHHNEFGAGIDYIIRNDVSENKSEDFIVPIAFAAYRYHYDNGWVFRGLFTPFYDIEREKIFPYFGLSFGKRF